MSSDQVYPIPIELVEPHPDFLFRFDYSDKKFEDLVESIRKHGQLQNGRVVPRPDGKGFEAYMGNRRLLALKKLHGETKDQRFAFYLAAIDKNLPRREMVLRALEENMKEVRREFTPLEEVRVFSRLDLKELEAIGGDRRYAKRATLAPSFDEKRCAELHRIETAYGFEFTLGHLEELAKEKDEKEFYMTAAAFAYTKASPKFIEMARKARDEVLGDQRFRELYPAYVEQDNNRREDDAKLGAQVQRQLLTDLLAKLGAKPSSGDTQRESEEVESKRNRGQELLAKLDKEGKLDEKETEVMRKLLANQEIPVIVVEGKGDKAEDEPPGPRPPDVQQNAILVECSFCGWENRTRLIELRVKVENLPDAPGETPIPVEPEVLMKYGKACPSCGKTFTINMLPVGREAVRAEGAKNDRFEEPKKLVRPVTTKFDWEKNHWEKYDTEGKLLGISKTARTLAGDEGRKKKEEEGRRKGRQ